MPAMSKFSLADQDDKAGRNQPNNHEETDSSEGSAEDEDIIDSADNKHDSLDEYVNIFIQDDKYEALDHQLDQLNSCLDVLEQQNDALKAELLNLLESSRQARREMQEEQQSQATDSTKLADDNLPNNQSS